MHYTVRLQFKVNGLRMIQTFIRPKYATNTSTYATQYPTIEAAEYEAHFHVQQMLQANGRLTFICADYLKVED